MERRQNKVSEDVHLKQTCTVCGELSSSCKHNTALNTITDPMIGQMVSDHFEIIALIGAGGMGSVYKAKHTIIGKLVAIKILTNPGSDKANMRFQREAKAASALNHAHIVSVLDFGFTTDNKPFIVMDLVEGVSLAESLKERGTLTPTDATEIFSQISLALAHAHSRGVIHRDIKPGNIMLCPDDAGSVQAKLVDFGIAKMESLDSDRVQSLTETGEIFGSPLYMSPEQCSGKALDARSDIYSLGCVMFESLTGKPPLVGGNIMQTIFMHVNDPPPAMDKNVPETLQRVVYGCLQKDANARYASATEICKELTEPDKKRQRKPASSPPSLAGRNKSSLLRPAIVVLLMVLMMVVALAAWISRVHERSETLLPPPQAPVSTPIQPTLIPSAATHLADPTELTDLGQQFLNEQKYKEATAVLLKADGIYKIYPSLEPSKLRANGHVVFLLGNVEDQQPHRSTEDALRFYAQALMLFRAAEDYPDAGAALIQIANILSERDAQAANRFFQEAVDNGLEHKTVDVQSLVVHQYALAQNLHKLHQDEQAEKWFKRSIATGQKRLDRGLAKDGWEVTGHLGRAKKYFADFYKDLGDTRSAKKLMNEGIQLMSRSQDAGIRSEAEEAKKQLSQ